MPGSIECRQHPPRQGSFGPDAILSGDPIRPIGVEESNHWIVPGRFVKTIEKCLVGAGLVVLYGHRYEERFDRLHEERIGKRSIPEANTGGTARNFLEEDQQGNVGPARLGGGRVPIPKPTDLTEFRWMVGHDVWDPDGTGGDGKGTAEQQGVEGASGSRHIVEFPV